MMNSVKVPPKSMSRSKNKTLSKKIKVKNGLTESNNQTQYISEIRKSVSPIPLSSTNPFQISSNQFELMNSTNPDSLKEIMNKVNP